LADGSQSQALPLFRSSARIRLIALSESRPASHAPALPPAAVPRSPGAGSASSRQIDLTVLRI
jgi:hypothetical protein